MTIYTSYVNVFLIYLECYFDNSIYEEIVELIDQCMDYEGIYTHIIPNYNGRNDQIKFMMTSSKCEDHMDCLDFRETSFLHTKYINNDDTITHYVEIYDPKRKFRKYYNPDIKPARE